MKNLKSETETNTVNSFDGIVRVSKIRSRDPIGLGGCIFSGHHVNDRGNIIDSRTLIVVKANGFQLPFKDAVEVGEHWRITGCSNPKWCAFDNYFISEVTVIPDTAIYKIRETGELIVHALATNANFKGIGYALAQALWNRFGAELYELLDKGNVEVLSDVLSEKIATSLVSAWREHASGQVYAFLQSRKFPVWLAKKVVEFYGEDAEKLLREDPYRLLSFCASWSKVDAMARQHFNVNLDDPKRLRAAVEESLYTLVDKQAHTAATAEMLKSQLKRLLSQNNNNETMRLVDKALSEGASNGAYLVGENGFYWPVGSYVMEEYIAQKMAAMIFEPDPDPTLFMESLTSANVDSYISSFEEQESKRLKSPFKLNPDQQRAIHMAVFHRFSIIHGAAGTGKTTVLRCLYYILKSVGYRICQMCLSGRATKRLQNVTGEKAVTIASFVKNAEIIVAKLGDYIYYIIDEASMLDLPTAYRIVRSMTATAENARIVMAGDPYQLPPIMAGLIFHVLVEASDVPKIELQIVERQKDSTGIPAVAHLIRHGILPELPADGKGGVRFIPCEEKEILPKLLELYADAPDETQILCATRHCVRSGANAINQACQPLYSKNERQLTIWNTQVEAYGGSGFRENDKIMFIRNDWNRDVQNGSIGHIFEVLDKPEMMAEYDEPVIAKANIEGEVVPIFQKDFDPQHPMLVLGFAVTVHKYQGSEKWRIILPIRHSRILDRNFVYTGITRAIWEVILIGDIDALRKAVEDPPRVNKRLVGFRYIFGAKMSNYRQMGTANEEAV